MRAIVGEFGIEPAPRRPVVKLTFLGTGEEFGRLFTSFDRTARRLETRNRYDVPDEREQLAQFLAGELDDDGHRRWITPWMETVHEAVAAGRRFERVRVVPDPLTDYLRLELRGNRYNAEAGEDIRYLDRRRANALDLPDHDFWLFDGDRLALQCFTADDRPLGALLITEPVVVRQHDIWLDLAFQHATPYPEYLAEDPGREDPPAAGAA
jgi:hypothetical protein